MTWGIFFLVIVGLTAFQLLIINKRIKELKAKPDRESLVALDRSRDEQSAFTFWLIIFIIASMVYYG